MNFNENYHTIDYLQGFIMTTLTKTSLVTFIPTLLTVILKQSFYGEL